MAQPFEIWSHFFFFFGNLKSMQVNPTDSRRERGGERERVPGFLPRVG